MNRTFRVRKYQFTGAVAATVLLGLLSIRVVVSAPNAAHPEGMAVTAVLLSAIAAMAVYAAIDAYCGYVRIVDREVVRQRPWSRHQLLLDGSVQVQWRIWPRRGSVVIRSPLERIAIELENYERNERVAIISHLRDTVAADQQTGWDMFCHRWALPLVEPPDEKNKVVLRRRHIDRLFAWMLLPNFGVTALLIWLDGWKWWPSIFVLVPLWLLQRFVIPKKGSPSAVVSAVPGWRWWVITFVSLVCGLFLHAWNSLVGIACWLAAGIAFVQFIRSANAYDRRQRQMATNADVRWRAALAAREGD